MSSIAEQVGRVIGGRYRLLAAVGTGASAQVFAADDARLGRRVALKLLHPGLAGDATFLRKFQAEARLAASLNHRNVLHVYDWGDEDGIPYLVLEYLGGGSLRSMLDAGARLSPAQAAAMGAQAAHGLAYAHRRGLVHRDVKPANLLFDDDGRLLVADFGLARALAEAAITEPLGALIGTARYASPEQVEGRAVDDRTDVYSLALTLYESVTGRVPFSGDTTVSTLMARVGAVLPPARELGPLAPVLAQAAISEPLARLDAAALASELELLCQELPPPEPLPLAGTDLAFSGPAGVSDRDPTTPFGVALPRVTAAGAAGAAAWGAIAGEAAGASPEQPWPVNGSPSQGGMHKTSADDVTTGAGAAGLAHAAGPAGAAYGSTDHATEVLPATAATGAPAGPAPAAPAPADRPPGAPAHGAPAAAPIPQGASGVTQGNAAAPGAQASGPAAVPGLRRISPPPAAPSVIAAPPPPERRKLHLVRWLLVAVLVLVAAGAGSVAVLRYAVYDHVVPSLAGLSLSKAEGRVHHAGLKLVVSRKHYDLAVPAGEIISQTPSHGAREKAGTPVKVVESLGPQPVPVPSLQHLTRAQAAAALTNGHLVATFPPPVYNETVPSGDVVSWSPSTPTLTWGSHVAVVISKGPAPRTIPATLVGGTFAQAQQQLAAIQLGVHESYEHSSTVSAGLVITTTPLAGAQVPRGYTVDVVVSLGPPLVQIPDVSNYSVAKATKVLERDGFKVAQYGPNLFGTIYAMYPSPGKYVPPGTTIDLYTL